MVRARDAMAESDTGGMGGSGRVTATYSCGQLVVTISSARSVISDQPRSSICVSDRREWKSLEGDAPAQVGEGRGGRGRRGVV